ncbi:MAG TPA: crotonase/enoyl-CoA hydratase family protein [Candidatus Binataceae bacterium]|nr:crotonase/enoyl-CoA hydratase family protein [Candidatus Binataceae bacterium]
MNYKCFAVTIDSKVAHIVLNRPEKRNSMIKEFWEELPDIIRDIDENARARVIVISSTGPHFSSGLDLGMFGQAGSALAGDPADQKLARRQRAAAFYGTVKTMQQSFTALESCRIPVIAAIQGGCIGGGVDLVTACDMRFATEDAYLTIQEINIGMTADVGTFPRLAKLIPEGIVRELAYTGRKFPAKEAHAAGLINRLFPDHKSMLEGVMAVAIEIARKAPLAVYGSKRMITYARDHSTADGLDYIGIWNASMLQPEEIMEAIGSNMEKRAGNFAELPVISPKRES